LWKYLRSLIAEQSSRDRRFKLKCGTALAIAQIRILYPFYQVVKRLPIIFGDDGFPDCFDCGAEEHCLGIGAAEAIAHLLKGFG
jgi:hypothetical protein